MYLKKRAYYVLEYKYIPVIINSYKQLGRKLFYFTDTHLWQRNLQAKYPSIYSHFDWDQLRVTLYGQEGDDVMVVYYDFPEPFCCPLASYGAIVIRGEEVSYYTFELSVDGTYVLGSKDIDMHFNYGTFPAMSPKQFLHKICDIEHISLPAKPTESRRKRRFRLWLNRFRAGYRSFVFQLFDIECVN
jgi:hypothetical protein